MRGLYAICINNCYSFCSFILVINLLFFLVNIQVFLKNKYPSSIMWNKFFFEIYKLCKNFLQKNEDNCYLRFIKSNIFQRKHTDIVLKEFILQCVRVMNSKTKLSKTFITSFRKASQRRIFQERLSQ